MQGWRKLKSRIRRRPILYQGDNAISAFSNNGVAEDVEIARSLRKVGVSCDDTRDAEGEVVAGLCPATSWVALEALHVPPSMIILPILILPLTPSTLRARDFSASEH